MFEQRGPAKLELVSDEMLNRCFSRVDDYWESLQLSGLASDACGS